jgi:hypothetical protein
MVTALLHRKHFDVVLRELISELQAFSQRVHKTSMVRFYLPVHSDDIVLIRQTTSRDGAFHDKPHNHRRNIERRPNARQRFATL